MSLKEDDDNNDMPVTSEILDDFAESFFDESVEGALLCLSLIAAMVPTITMLRVCAEEFQQFIEEESPKFRNLTKDQAHDQDEHSLEYV